MLDDVPLNIQVSETGQLKCEKYTIDENVRLKLKINENLINDNCSLCTHYHKGDCFISKETLDKIIESITNKKEEHRCILCNNVLTSLLAILLKKYLESKSKKLNLSKIPILCCDCHFSRYHNKLDGKITKTEKKFRNNKKKSYFGLLITIIIGLIILNLGIRLLINGGFLGSLGLSISLLCLTLLIPIVFIFLIRHNIKVDEELIQNLDKNKHIIKMMK